MYSRSIFLVIKMERVKEEIWEILPRILISIIFHWHHMYLFKKSTESYGNDNIGQTIVVIASGGVINTCMYHYTNWNAAS